jgi:dolichol-phosphate mannosyltransferase
MEQEAELLTRIAVVIPCFRVTHHILGVIAEIGSEVWRIYIVDDKCPDNSANYVEANCTDPRVRIVRHDINQGVGGAVMTGYQIAIADGAEVIVKVDGDGQMNPALIPYFVQPILEGEADYTKGNRFYDLDEIGVMPPMRLFGNTILSLMSKFSTGYWDLFDPTNGYTAIHADVAKHLPFEKISRRYFFESDILFRLNVMRAVAVDIPMSAKYADEVSGLKVSKIVGEFLVKHTRNFAKRIFYNYYLRDLSPASLELPIGLLLLVFGICYGAYHWFKSVQAGIPTPTGTVMLAALPILMGLQFVLAFIGQDIGSVPRRPRHLGRLFNYRSK